MLVWFFFHHRRHGYGRWLDILEDARLGLQPVVRAELLSRKGDDMSGFAQNRDFHPNDSENGSGKGTLFSKPKKLTSLIMRPHLRKDIKLQWFFCAIVLNIYFIYAFFSWNMLMGRLGFFMSYLQNSTKVTQWRTIHERKSEMLTGKTASWVFVWYLFL
jgi:hypothetical protein